MVSVPACPGQALFLFPCQALGPVSRSERQEYSRKVMAPQPRVPGPGGTHVLHTAMVWHASPVQNSEIVLYCRLTWWKNVVAAGGEKSRCELHLTRGHCPDCLELGQPALLTDQRQTPRVEHQPWEQPPATTRQAANTRVAADSHRARAPPPIVDKLPTSVRDTTSTFTHPSWNGTLPGH